MKRLEALALLVMGGTSLWFAPQDDYSRLVNPDFRVVTAVGAILLLIMSLALALRPRRARPWALLVFGAFYAIVAIGNPLAPDGPNAFAFQEKPQAEPRAGYAQLEPAELFRSLDEDAEVAEGKRVISGTVYRSEVLDTEQTFILLDPLMACCVADAIAYGVRVKAQGELPQTASWVHVYGTLQRQAPVTTPRFRFGNIVFAAVSRRYRIDADDIASFRSLLPGVHTLIPADRCSRFLARLDLEELSSAEYVTVFAPLDLSFEMQDPRDFIVEGSYTERDLMDRRQLTTLSGRTLRIETVNGTVRLDGARVLFGDQVGRNGVVHVIHPAWSAR